MGEFAVQDVRGQMQHLTSREERAGLPLNLFELLRDRIHRRQEAKQGRRPLAGAQLFALPRGENSGEPFRAHEEIFQLQIAELAGADQITGRFGRDDDVAGAQEPRGWFQQTSVALAYQQEQPAVHLRGPFLCTTNGFLAQRQMSFSLHERDDGPYR